LVAESVKRFGVCRESMFPFDESKLFIPPPILADRESYLNKVEGHFRIASTGSDRVDDIIANLQVQNPVVFGTEVGQDWFDYNSKSDPLGVCQSSKGRHAMCIVGWVGGLFIVENSWGNTWGNNGFAFVKPELFMSPATQDLWIYVNSSDVWFERGGQ
jgi:C1A family cysteine protease